jgi:cephalosporin hydroxylase
MRSRQLDLTCYNSDKIASGYLERYDSILQPLLDRDVKLLELGIHEGGSLLLWRDYFPKSTIVGIDLKVPENLAAEARIQVFQGSQADTDFLTAVASKTAPNGFDVIIDDASHLGRLTKIAFWHLFDNHLKPGGL